MSSVLTVEENILQICSKFKTDFWSLNQNICCRYSKEPSQWDSSFEQPKYIPSDALEGNPNFMFKFFSYLNLYLMTLSSGLVAFKLYNIYLSLCLQKVDQVTMQRYLTMTDFSDNWILFNLQIISCQTSILDTHWISCRFHCNKWDPCQRLRFFYRPSHP